MDWKKAILRACKQVPIEVTCTDVYQIVREGLAGRTFTRTCRLCGTSFESSRSGNLPQYNTCPECTEARREESSEKKRAQQERDDKRKRWAYERKRKAYMDGTGTAAQRFWFMTQFEIAPSGSIRRDQQVKALTAIKYSEFLGTRYWITVRDYKLHKSGHKCGMCGSRKNLNVHHTTYEHHGNEHDYLDDLIVLCRNCHAKFHDKLAKEAACQ
jgi:hypothetical protein